MSVCVHPRYCEGGGVFWACTQDSLMERRGRVRENPELKLGETLKRSNSKSSTSQEGCAGRAGEFHDG